MGQVGNKWRKWKVGASSAAVILLLLTAIQNSDAFEQAVSVKSSGNDDALSAKTSDQELYVDAWSSRQQRGQGSMQRSQSSDSDVWSSRDSSTGGMSSRSGRS